MESKALLVHIKPEWKNAFSKFVETGEASDDFLVYLDKDAEAQQAVEKAFKSQAAAFENLAGALQNVGTPNIGTPNAGTQKMIIQTAETEPYVAETLSATVARAMEKILDLPVQEQARVMKNAASVLRASPKRAALRSAVQSLEKEL